MTPAGKIAAGIVGIAIPGGAALAAGAALYSASATGDADLDVLRLPATLGIVRAFHVRARPAIVRRFMAILHNEDAYVPDEDGLYPLGDVGVTRANPNRHGDFGPAIGPGQVLLSNLERLGFTDGAALAHAARRYEAVYAAALVFREAFDEKAGDLDAASARYNGFGAAAEAYAERARAFDLKIGRLA